jgi:hypothetical protein
MMIGEALLMMMINAAADYPAPPHWSDAQREVWETILQWNDAFEANDVMA